MRRHRKLALVATIVAAVLAADVASASANRLSVTERAINIIWDVFGSEGENITFESTSGGLAVECPLTLEGSFHSSTFTKTSAALIGYITRAAIDRTSPPCTYESISAITVLSASLPWTIRYASFAGTLPLIREVSVSIVGLSFLVTAFGVSCLYRSTEIQPARGIFDLNSSGTVTQFAADFSSTIPLASGGILCPALFSWINEGAVHRLGSRLNAIGVRLI